MRTLQGCLRRLYCSLGGNADDVRGEDDVNRLLAAMSGLSIGEKIRLAAELPEAPTEDGTYLLAVTVSDGTATYSWQAQEETE